MALTQARTVPAPRRAAGGALTWGLSALGLVVLLVAPFAFYPLFLVKLLCFALFAAAFNLLVGQLNLLSFGHAAFLGTGAYVAGHVAKVWGLPFELAILAGALAAGVLGAGFGYISIRRQGIQFAMITLALAQLVYFLAFQLPFTHAEDGLQTIPRGSLLGLLDLTNLYALYYTTAGIFLGGYLLIRRISQSTFGQILKGIRENQPRMVSLGFRVNRYKLAAFVLSATLAGVAGAVKAQALGLASTTDVHWTTSGSVILMTLLGGMGTLLGPVVGAAVVITLEEYLAQVNVPTQAVTGAIFILCILLFRRGIVGEAKRFLP